MSQVAHQAGTYPGFYSMKRLGKKKLKRLGVFYFSLDRMVVHRRVTPGIKFDGTRLYTAGEKTGEAL